MKKNWTQRELYDFLEANPLGTKIHIGNLEDMNNEDYIFFDRFADNGIYADDGACYVTTFQFTIATKGYDDRDTLVDYLHSGLNINFSYSTTDEREYYVAQGQSALLISGKS